MLLVQASITNKKRQQNSQQTAITRSYSVQTENNKNKI